ncbi:carboxylesterase [Sclerotinia borealis F-4128]|uniref:Carboxylesterase n=1 Tax=Sclerotinia borealis (strain F-4128) TaxID=1432307 RepID=W9CQ42_SCLBF|nr:carboxylesterase [Sclerotinia borealis F-4128]
MCSVSQYYSNWNQISFFGGTPFAADASGNSRWREPQPAAPWNGTFQATYFGPICPSGIAIDDLADIAIWSYGAGVASKDIIFVSYNYRAGALRFFSNPDLTVHENIAAFGGDPDHISAIGQSFGAAVTYHIVNSNLTADLGIVNAISESGVRSPNDP